MITDTLDRNSDEPSSTTTPTIMLPTTVPSSTTPPILLHVGSIDNPATSCNQISQDHPSGDYWIQPINTSVPLQAFCDSRPRNCSCNSTGGWARVANLDMTDPSQNCPEGFRQVNRTEPPLHICGRPGQGIVGCVSTTFPTRGIEYSRV